MARKNKNVAQVENVAPAEGEAAEVATNVENANTESPKAEAKAICLVPGCGREAKIRGLCGRCGTAARAQIKKCRTTWAKLEELGLATPPKKAAFGSGEPGVFAKALAAKLGDKKD